MKTTGLSARAWAFSLIELLCVIAIIGLLAALLLPALGQAKARAKRIQCVSNLHQIGIGFINFANEHSGKFPMAVPMSAGGSMEFARNGYLIQGDFFFSFRHFQVLSNELVTPKVVVCPTDTRPPAASFAALKNDNLSYFVGVNAYFALPNSVLSGDRNLTNDYVAAGTLMHLGPNYALRWTRELHEFKGNLLFSDGRVEEKNNPELASALNQAPAVADLALPTSQQVGTAASARGSGIFPCATSAPRAHGSHVRAASANPPNFAPGPSKAFRTAASTTALQRTALSSASVAPEETALTAKVERPSTNTVAKVAPAKRQLEEANLSLFGIWLATVMERSAAKGMWLFYLLLLLLIVAALVIRRLARGRKKSLQRAQDV